MKFKYLYVSIGGDEPKGTNDPLLAKTMALDEDAWVIDVDSGTIIDSEGEYESDVEEADASDYIDPTGDDDTDD